MTKRLESEDITRPLADSARELKERVLTIEKTLMVPDLKKGWPGQFNHGIQLTRKLAQLVPDVSVGDYRPTDQAAEVLQKLTGEIHDQIASFEELLNGDLAEFNAMLAQYQLKAIG